MYLTNCSFDAKKDTECARTDAMLYSLKQPTTKIYFLFLSYVLKLLNAFNIEFQSEEPKIHLLLSKITTLYKTILRNFVKASVINNTTEIDLIDFQSLENHIPVQDIYIGSKCEAFINTLPKFGNNLEIKLKIQEFYMELCSQIKKRFNLSDDKLKMFSYFKPEIVLSGEIPSIISIVKMFPMFEPKCHEINEEWRAIPNLENFKFDNVNDFWHRIGNIKNELNIPMFNNVAKLGRAIIALPHSSANTERAFSQLNLVKNKTRNRLSVASASSLLSSKTYLKYNNINQNVCYSWEPTQLIINKKSTDNENALDQEIEPEMIFD